MSLHDHFKRNYRYYSLFCFILLLLLFFYVRCFNDYFYFDDFVFLERSKIEHPSDVINFFSIELNKYGLKEKNHSYRPLSTNFYFGFLRYFFGLNSIYYHISNFIFLVLNSFLVFYLLNLLGIQRNSSAIVAFLYSICALNFESQLWLSVIQDLSVTFFLLLSIITYIVWKERKSNLLYFLSVTFYFLAILSKEMAVTLPVLLLIHDYLFSSKTRLGKTKPIIPYILITILYLVFRSIYFIYPAEGSYAIKIGSFVFTFLAKYISWSINALLLFNNILSYIFLIALFFFFIIKSGAKGRNYYLFGIMWFLVSLTPVLFLPNHIYKYYLIFPVIGFLLCLAKLMEDINRYIQYNRGRIIIVITFVTLFYAISYSRFMETAHRMGHRTESFKRIVQYIKDQYPDVPDYTNFFFVFPPGFPSYAFLKNDGSVIRVIYDNPTLKGYEVTTEDNRNPNNLEKTGNIIVRVTEE